MSQSKKQSAVIAGVILLLSLGALSWQVVQLRQRDAQLREAEAMVGGTPTSWRAATALERKAAQTAITRQLDAFKRDDYQKAAQYQSKSLRANFPSVAAFRRMIRTNYPQFARYKTVEFGSEQIDSAGRYFRVPVTVLGSDGIAVEAMYDLIVEEGGWRVAGVRGGVGRRITPKPAVPRKGEITA